jgi:probable addiction module antidote protein/putative addiction module killer protein
MVRATSDEKAQFRILARIRRMSLGHFGDVKPVGEGVSELRIDYGPGYRVYLRQQGQMWVLLLAGGNKKTQTATSPRPNSWPGSGKMSLKTTLWDASEFLDSPESSAAYLEAGFEDGDPALIAAALGDVARAIGMTQLASQAGVTREALYKALSPTGDPKLSTFLGVMKALGLKLAPRAA